MPVGEALTHPMTSADVVRVQFAALERGGIDAVAEYWHGPGRADRERPRVRDARAGNRSGGLDGPQTGGVPYVWKLSTVCTPQACPFARSASLHTVGSRSGS